MSKLQIRKNRKHFAVVLNFQCLLAAVDERIYGWDTTRYRQSIKTARQTFERNAEILENNDVTSHYYYCYGRYLNNTKENSEAMEYGEKCYELRLQKDPTSMDKVDQIIGLHLLGMIDTRRKENPEAAKKCFEKAISFLYL